MRQPRTCGILTATALAMTCQAASPAPGPYTLILRGGLVYDGSGAEPFVADIALTGARIAAIAPHIAAHAAREIDAHGRAVAPGFVNMLAHPEESLLVDGRAQSDLRQGVTLEVLGEDSMGPLSAKMKADMTARQGDLHYTVSWTTLGDYLDLLQHQGISLNVASYVGAGTVRTAVLGERDVQPNAAQLTQMRQLVRAAMEQGAVGVTTALEYVPDSYAATPELVALATQSAECGGLYAAHMRSESDHLAEAVGETIAIARQSGGPAEIYTLKAAGKRNWGKLADVTAQIEAARHQGIRITADMYPYTASATGLDITMPPWVQEGGLEAWVKRLGDPAIRARLHREMTDPNPSWENGVINAGADGVLFLSFKNPKLKPYAGQTLADVAHLRGTDVADTLMDLVAEDKSRVGAAYFEMSEENVRRQVALPWMSFDSDESAPSIEGAFLQSSYHPRAFGSFARVLAHYVRDEKALTLQAAIRKLAALPADVLSLEDRGRLLPGYFADIVVFDPAAIADHATFKQPMQYATGVQYVLVNGQLAIDDGKVTQARPGAAIRGRAWTGMPGGGCRASSKDWRWAP